MEEKIPIMKRSENTDDAIELFHRHRMYDKERLFRYRRVSRVNIYSIGGFEDYYYGYMYRIPAISSILIWFYMTMALC